MKRIVIGLVVAIVLLVAADFASASAAEYQVATRMREQLALPDTPSVQINGFPFLTQALAGDYGQVDVSADRLTVGALRAVGVRAELYHVRAPLGELLGGTLRSIKVDDAKATVQITKDDLMRQMPGVTKLAVFPVDQGALDAALANSSAATPGSSVDDINPDQAVRLVATTSFMGETTEVSVIAVLQLVGRQIQISPRDIRIGSGSDAAKLPQAAQTALRGLFTLRLDPGTLPFDVRPTSLRAVDSAVEVSGVAHNLVINSAPSKARQANGS